MAARSSPPIVSAEFAAAAGTRASLPPPVTLEVAFVGRSNVGKSTLLNGLMRRKGLARTSNTPGCTRTINFFEVRTQDGLSLRLVDLPGYGYAKRAKSERLGWADMIEEYLLERPTLRLVVLLFDARRGPEQEERDVLELLESEARSQRPEPKTLLVATKLDKLPQREQRAVLERYRELGRPLLGARPEADAYLAIWAKIRSLLEHDAVSK